VSNDINNSNIIIKSNVLETSHKLNKIWSKELNSRFLEMID